MICIFGKIINSGLENDGFNVNHNVTESKKGKKERKGEKGSRVIVGSGNGFWRRIMQGNGK